MVNCPICGKRVRPNDINSHIDSGCEAFLETPALPTAQLKEATTSSQKPPASQKAAASNFFSTPATKRTAVHLTPKTDQSTTSPLQVRTNPASSNGTSPPNQLQLKRPLEEAISGGQHESTSGNTDDEPALKRSKKNAFDRAAPLAERMRPRTLDDVCGQELVGEHGVLRSLIEMDRVPSMILWGGAGTGKTTIARCTKIPLQTHLPCTSDQMSTPCLRDQSVDSITNISILNYS